MTAASIVTSVLAAYAATVSTLSLILAVKVFKAGNPKVTLSWEYIQSENNLTLMVLNTGRADVTISTVELRVMRERIISRSRNGKYFKLYMETISQIPGRIWAADDVAIPYRLISNSAISISVNIDAIRLPPEIPFDELLLKFLARYPGGRQTVYFRGDVLRHSIGVDPDIPVRSPSLGSLPPED